MYNILNKIYCTLYIRLYYTYRIFIGLDVMKVYED